MSWGPAKIIVPSPRVRRKSRPLSMIYENPDDNNADPNTNPSIGTVYTPNLDPTTTTNYINNIDLGKKTTHQELTRSLSPSPQTTRATTPTRRKAVAPLQHPVTILLDNQSHSHQSYSTCTKQLHDLSVVHQTNIQTTHSTPVVHSNSIIKQFSSLENSNAGGNSSQVTNNSHSTVLTKTANKYRYNENSKAKNDNSTTLNDGSNTGFTGSIGILEEEEEDVMTNGISKSASDFTTNKDDICTSSNYNDDVKDSDSHSCSVSHNENVCCQCLKHGNTCKTNDNIDGDETDRDDNNNYNNNDDKRTSNINCRSISFLDGYSNDYEIPEVSQPSQVLHSKHETYPHSLHQKHPHKMATSINYDEVHSPIKHNQDIKFISSIPDSNPTATTTTRIDPSSDPRHNNQTSADSKVGPESDPSPPDTLKHQRLSAGSVLKVDTKSTKESQSNLRRSDNEATSEKNTPHCDALDKNTPCSDTLHKNTQDNNTPTKNTLDSDTLEWKRRVTRSVSFIKVSNTPESPKTRRRVSFTQPSNLSHSNTVFWKNGHRIHSNAMNTTAANNNINNINSNNSIYSKSAILGVSKSNENKDTNDRVENPSDDNNEPVRRISAIDQSDFSLLKVATTRLNLPTRRPSFTAWKEKYLNRNGPGEYVVSSSVGIDTPNGRLDWAKTDNVNNKIDNKFDGKDEWNLTEDVKNRIDGSIAWLRQELIDIRLQDQSLARQFLNLRHAMNAFRLAVECEGHQELIDDAEEDMEEVRELSQLVDIPPEMLSHLSPLKQVGITRMNISCRRFSTC